MFFIFHYANVRIHQVLCLIPATLIPYLLQTNLHTVHSLSKPAAFAHKNISWFYYYSHISHIVLVVSCTKRIPIPVSLESESITPGAQFTQSNIIPLKPVNSVLHKQRACLLFQTGEGFFFKKSKTRNRKTVFCIKLCYSTRRDKGLVRKQRK